MTIDWIHFTPWASLAGGAVIGLASGAFILLNARVLGISGILGGLLPARKGDSSWRILFLLGMLAAPLLWTWLAPVSVRPMVEVARIDASFGLVILAGLLVGLGTRYGSGCTSGHGVCGLSRLSLRSLVATLIFMATGFLTVYCTRHLF